MPGTETLIQQRGTWIDRRAGRQYGSLDVLHRRGSSVGIDTAPTPAPCVSPVIDPKRTPAIPGAPVLVSRPYSQFSHIANLVLHDNEYHLVQDLTNRGFKYSRLLDDITISSSKYIKPHDAEKIIKNIVRV